MSNNVNDVFWQLQQQRKLNIYNTVTNSPRTELRKALLNDFLIKGRELPIGSISTHGGVKVKKTGKDKWVPVADEKSSISPIDMSFDEVEQAITDIITNNSLSQTNKIKGLFELGITDKKEVAKLAGAHYSRVSQLSKKFMSKNPVAQQRVDRSKEEQVALVESLPEEVKEALPTITVDERWESYSLFVDMVAAGMSKSAIAYGTGGVGKTYTMTQVLKKYGFVEFTGDEELGSDEYNYVKITGKATATAMYQALFEHNGKLIVFDDCDSVLQDETSVNIFKGALDTSGAGTVTYASPKAIKTERVSPKVNSNDQYIVPSRFDFTGRVIFISNLSPDKMPQPLVDSRSLAVDLTMSVEDTVERLRTIGPLVPIEDIEGNKIESVTNDDKKEVIDFIEKHSRQIRPGKLNTRTFINITKIKDKTKGTGMNWKTAGLAMLS